jgi:hypothetical protein
MIGRGQQNIKPNHVGTRHQWRTYRAQYVMLMIARDATYSLLQRNCAGMVYLRAIALLAVVYTAYGQVSANLDWILTHAHVLCCMHIWPCAGAFCEVTSS